MEIHFENNGLKSCCNSHSALLKQYGKQMASIVRRRLDSIDAAVSLEQIRNLPGRCREVSGNRAYQLSIDLHPPYQLILVPKQLPSPRKADGGLDWTKVTSVLILELKESND